MDYRFPFGMPVERVEQVDLSPKRVFVLGVYSSAVHARWMLPEGRGVRALAVASEPMIFWNGDPVEAENIINAIPLPPGCGRLVPAARQLNGPSGRSLDRDYLEPLGLKREDAWLCDLLPESRMNANQKEALSGDYADLVEAGKLSAATIPTVPSRYSDDARAAQVSHELEESKADVLITLGDLPLREFTSRFGTPRRLAAFGRGESEYGRLHPLEIDGYSVRLLPLVHPRQAARLGGSSSAWTLLHAYWMNNVAGGLRLGVQ